MDRITQQKREEELLSPPAAKSAESRGRRWPEEECVLRTCFQRDRDRIIHSKAFRRLKHKTQVFIAPEGDHYRTRLTHTLEVAQIARTIARSLRLNEDLTEAIALGHDLGHTPFGHTGEQVLNAIHPGGFEHNVQSLRVVDHLERHRQNGGGLNLCFEVRDGIRGHTGDQIPSTLEGRIVRIADRVAYINHDIDDAQRADILIPRDLPTAAIEVLGEKHGERINTMIMDIITASRGEDAIQMTDRVKQATDELRSFLFERVYIDSEAKGEEKKAANLLRKLYEYYVEHPDEILEKSSLDYGASPDAGILALDYIAGMTDRYALTRYHQLFVPSPWGWRGLHSGE